MANHARKQIRDAFATALDAISGGPAVYVSRVYALQTEELPALCVFTETETVELDEREMGADPTLLRTLTVVVECRVKLAEGALDTADSLAVDVENAVASDAALNDLVVSADLAEVTLSVAEGDVSTAVAALRYAVKYQTSTANPQTLL